ncbi:DUF2752 domain-containing protein [bacterium]|nr:DUF2752 domain-containing protein [bacterium]MBU1637253.1 DUF2752 domain-containing protein [bacterium]MBU1920270.1 DUF2752 domain-containing protein [bacterium]
MRPVISYRESHSPQRERITALAVVALTVAAGLFLHYVNPLQQLAWLRCPVNLTTGLYCPGCGSLRAIHALLNGDIVAALSANLLAVAALPVLAGIGVRSLFRIIKGCSPTIRIHPIVAWSIFWTVILFAVLRNLPFEITRALHP